MLVTQIKFTEWTIDDQLRQPVILGLRTDFGSSYQWRALVSKLRVAVAYRSGMAPFQERWFPHEFRG